MSSDQPQIKKINVDTAETKKAEKTEPNKISTDPKQAKTNVVKKDPVEERKEVKKEPVKEKT